MPAKRYPVLLDPDQREFLMDLISCGRDSARKLTRARILLKADESEGPPAYADKQIREAVEVSIPTIERTRKTFALEGLTAALTPKKRSRPPQQKFDGDKEAHLIALACSQPPEGHARWTLRLLVSEEMVELHHFSSISHESIRQVLKKTNCVLGASSSGVSPQRLRRHS